MSRMHWYFAVIFFLAAFFIQTAMLWKWPIYGFSPNLLLCIVVVFSFMYDERYGLVYGLAAGALLDVTTSMYFGPQTLTFFIAYIAAGRMRLVFNQEKIIPDVLVALIVTPIYALLMWGSVRLTGNPKNISYMLESLPVLLVMHALLTALFHLLLVRSIIRHRRDRRYKSDLV